MQAVIFSTYGNGYWSRAVKAVRIVDMRLGYVSDEKDFGELCVYFNTEDWDVTKDGLIYTDSGFITDLRNFLTMQGLDNLDIEYSEQGMQGDDYVSLDIGADFIASWEAKFGEVEAQ
jgi:hypothetical protein